MKFVRPPGCHCVYVKHFRHWRSGKMIYAADYGWEAFRIRKCRSCRG